MSYLLYLYLFAYSGVYCVVFLFCLSSSCVATFSGLSIIGCPFGILERLFSN